jgi:hypothetical protein
LPPIDLFITLMAIYFQGDPVCTISPGRTAITQPQGD